MLGQWAKVQMMSKIVLLKDVYALKEQKERELAFYKEILAELQEKLFWVEKELKLTKDIIKLIQEERVTYIAAE